MQKEEHQIIKREKKLFLNLKINNIIWKKVKKLMKVQNK